MLRFCVAPLDVLKIRLQLQTHSLSDPLSIREHRGPVYSGTWHTFRTIVKDEGVTVRLVRASTMSILTPTGFMERQYSGRVSIRCIWSLSIHDVSGDHKSTSGAASEPQDARDSRVMHCRSLRRRNSDDGLLSARPASYSVRRLWKFKGVPGLDRQRQGYRTQ